MQVESFVPGADRDRTQEDQEESAVEDALLEAGLSRIEAPRSGTEAYRRLIAAATGYMNEVKHVE